MECRDFEANQFNMEAVLGRRGVVCLFLLVYVLHDNSHSILAENVGIDLGEHAEHFYGSDQAKSDEECGWEETENEEDGMCVWNKESVDEGPLRLARLDGVQVGHVEKVEMSPGVFFSLRTVNMKPLIFEIQDFFSAEECEHIIALAKEEGLAVSATHANTGDKSLRLLDTNGDKRLSLLEMRRTIEDGYDIYLTDDDIKEMYYHLKMDKNNDDFISKAEMGNFNVRLLARYITELAKKNPIKKSRYSEQAWIYPDQTQDSLVTEFQRRIQILTQLPEQLIDKHSYFQVVKYGQHGHYNAHLDSAGDDRGLPCCHLTNDKNCRICRYLTIMVYLTDVEQGGETAFVVANNDTFSDAKLRESGNINLNSYCSESKLHIKPERGKAVMWYNHFVDEETGWFGDVDYFTWHGGCPVVRGEKWIMNRWICATRDRDVDLA